MGLQLQPNNENSIENESRDIEARMHITSEYVGLLTVTQPTSVTASDHFELVNRLLLL